MSRCRVEKRIWQHPTRNSDYTCLYYELEVSDAPERGRELRDGRWFSGPLSSIVWSAVDEQFKCRVPDEVPLASPEEEYSHDFLVENALQEGWQICPLPHLEVIH